MYFVHSFFVEPDDSRVVLATTRYGDVEFAAAVRYDNVFGCQYHPERSGPEGLAVYRLRGHMPLDAHTLRWYYGLVIDPYPLTIRRADGRLIVEEVGGDAWSRTIDLSGQFQQPRFAATTAGFAIAALLLIPLLLRVVLNTKDTKEKTCTC